MINDFITIHTADGDYKVCIGEFENISFEKKYSKVLVVTSHNVAGFYLAFLKNKISHQQVFECIVDDREENKDFTTIQQILDCAFTNKLDRKSLMIALGGGVISDMVGFASGIYQRGIDFINIPTTLLAQVDASVGGKTGINTHFGKNLIGIFHQPKKVYVNPLFLKTLKQREFFAGIAEILKIAICFDRAFFDFLFEKNLNNLDVLSEAIKKSIKLKADIVEQDEREDGIRMGLNYGHTFAHVIELETNYKKFLHGEAVAIGMQMANSLALKLGLLSPEEVKKIEFLLEKYHLLLQYRICDIKGFYNKFFIDKKTCYDTLRFILPNGIGKMKIVDNVEKEKLLEVLGVYA